MVKKINILVLSLLILLSVGAVSATDDINSTLDSDNAILEVSDDVELSSNSHTVTQKNYNQYFVSDGLGDSVKAGDTIYLDGSLSD